ncbi:MAG: hypothetical protein IPM36_20755 [Lewinellaceae bacterium]|nr:hypothetical protein [Lewinellaceae bacterium]
MTFACISATDALHNTPDWVATDPANVAIVVASILPATKQVYRRIHPGCRAVAMLVKWHPRLLKFRRLFGCPPSVHDFTNPAANATPTPRFSMPSTQLVLPKPDA